MRTIAAIASAHAGQRVLIVTHAGVINQVLGSIVGQSAACWHNFRPDNASLTCVRWERGAGGVIECYNDRVHLTEQSTHQPCG
jgi:broad specificity phosphatase PhoE